MAESTSRASTTSGRLDFLGRDLPLAQHPPEHLFVHLSPPRASAAGAYPSHLRVWITQWDAPQTQERVRRSPNDELSTFVNGVANCAALVRQRTVKIS